MLRLVCDVLLSAVPAYRTYQAVLQPDPAAVKRWLTFWVVATFVSMAELVEGLVSWVPGYWLCKTMFVAWMVFGGGADTVYNRAVLIFLQRWEGVIDASLAAARDTATAGLSRAAQTSVSRSTELLGAGMGMLARLQAQQAVAQATAALTNAATHAGAVGARPVPIPSAPAAGTYGVHARSATAPAELTSPDSGALSDLNDDDLLPGQIGDQEQRFGPTVGVRQRRRALGALGAGADRFGRPSDGGDADAGVQSASADPTAGTTAGAAAATGGVIYEDFAGFRGTGHGGSPGS